MSLAARLVCLLSMTIGLIATLLVGCGPCGIGKKEGACGCYYADPGFDNGGCPTAYPSTTAPQPQQPPRRPPTPDANDVDEGGDAMSIADAGADVTRAEMDDGSTAGGDGDSGDQ